MMVDPLKRKGEAVFITAQWPVFWAGVLLVALCAGLVRNLGKRRSARIDRHRRRTHLEWLPGLLGLLAIIGQLPGILGTGRDAVTSTVCRTIIAAVLALLVYGVVVLVGRAARTASRLWRTPPSS